MKNWKTTVGGLLGGAGVAMQAAADPKIHIAGYVLAGVALTWFGYHAQDKQPQ